MNDYVEEARTQLLDECGTDTYVDMTWTVTNDGKVVCQLRDNHFPTDEIREAIIKTYKNAGYTVTFKASAFLPPVVEREELDCE